MRHDPEVGTLYTPSLKLRVAAEKGGYLVRTNAAGFRSEQEFAAERTPGKFRALVFGDSQTSADGVSNKQRFSDLLERKIPGLETYNYGLTATGPDQHFLIYEKQRAVKHDLLVIVVYAENIRRVCRRIFALPDPKGSLSYYSKPYFELEHGELKIRNVPVPKQIWSEETLPDEHRPHIYSFHETSLFAHITKKKNLAPRLPKAFAPLREFIRMAAARSPMLRMLPEYNTPNKPEWLLLRAVLENWIHSSPTPVLLVTIPHYITFVSGRDPTRYRARFKELVDATSCHYIDILPDVLKLSNDDRRKLWSDWSGHITVPAHELIAERLAPVIQNIMRGSEASDRLTKN